jgi:hypothetical protein
LDRYLEEACCRSHRVGDSQLARTQCKTSTRNSISIAVQLVTEERMSFGCQVSSNLMDPASDRLRRNQSSFISPGQYEYVCLRSFAFLWINNHTMSTVAVLSQTHCYQFL